MFPARETRFPVGKPPLNDEGHPMPQEVNLPINEPSLIGVAQAVTVPDPTGSVSLSVEPETMQRRLWFLFPLVALGTSAV